MKYLLNGYDDYGFGTTFGDVSEGTAREQNDEQAHDGEIGEPNATLSRLVNSPRS